MAKISYGDYKDIISYLQASDVAQEDKATFFQSKGIESQALIGALSDIVAGGKKHITSLDKIFAEAGELSTGELITYAENVGKFLEHHGFAPPLLVREFPKEYIENFSQAAWAPITKTDYFKKADYDGRKLALTLAGIYGVFESDPEAGSRLSSLVNMLQGKTIEDLEHFNGLEMQYDPQFFRLVKENPELLTTMNLAELQSRWESISRCVDIKTPENIQRYMQISQEKGGNEFDTYMAYHNVPEDKIRRYKGIYDQMLGRTETSLPTIEGATDKGYSYEMLAFDDIRVPRFGETIKCCQRLDSVAETSMINSAIEATSRVIMITDEAGKPVAGSFVTHRMDRDGRSYVCFDSIEVKAAKLPIKAKDYTKTLKKIDKLVKKGILPSSEIDAIEAFREANPNNKYISAEEVEALKINKKIREAYQMATEQMIAEDEKKRGEQLARGEITQEEHDRLLIKNGRVTVGRNPVSMYLGDLPQIDKKEQELLPARVRDGSIYRKAHKFTMTDVAKGVGTVAIAASPILAVTSGPVVGAMFAAYGIWANKKLTGKYVHHQTYSDAFEQRSLYDGRTDKVPAISDPEQIKALQQKLVYSQYEVLSPGTQDPARGDLGDVLRVADLTPEQAKGFRRLREEAGLGDFTEQDQDRYVIGNAHNWCATITRDGANLTVGEIAMMNSFGFGRKQAMLADAQVQLMGSLQTLAGRAESMTFETGDPRIDQYLGKHVTVRNPGDVKEQTREQQHDTEIGI